MCVIPGIKSSASAVALEMKRCNRQAGCLVHRCLVSDGRHVGSTAQPSGQQWKHAEAQVAPPRTRRVTERVYLWLHEHARFWVLGSIRCIRCECAAAVNMNISVSVSISSLVLIHFHYGCTFITCSCSCQPDCTCCVFPINLTFFQTPTSSDFGKQ